MSFAPWPIRLSGGEIYNTENIGPDYQMSRVTRELLRPIKTGSRKRRKERRYALGALDSLSQFGYCTSYVKGESLLSRALWALHQDGGVRAVGCGAMVYWTVRPNTIILSIPNLHRASTRAT